MLIPQRTSPTVTISMDLYEVRTGYVPAVLIIAGYDNQSLISGVRTLLSLIINLLTM